MAHYMEGLQTPLLFYRMEVIFCCGGSGGGDLAGVTGAKRYSEVRSLGRLAVTTFLTGEKSRASPEGSARKTFLGGSRSTPLCSQAS